MCADLHSEHHTWSHPSICLGSGSPPPTCNDMRDSLYSILWATSYEKRSRNLHRHHTPPFPSTFLCIIGLFVPPRVGNYYSALTRFRVVARRAHFRGAPAKKRREVLSSTLGYCCTWRYGHFCFIKHLFGRQSWNYSDTLPRTRWNLPQVYMNRPPCTGS